MDLIDTIKEALKTHDAGLIGCHRKNRWTDDEYRDVRGNALLELAGDKIAFSTPVGPFNSYIRDKTTLLQFHGGPWKEHRRQDIIDEWCIVMAHTSMDLDDEAKVLIENKGELSVKTIPIPDVSPYERFTEILDSYTSDPPGRIDKSTSKAYNMCRYCPVKQKCDATDKQEGDTDDWGASYPIP